MTDDPEAKQWTISQAAVWIRTRDLSEVEGLDDLLTNSLAVALIAIPDILDANHCLKVALAAGWFCAWGRKARPDINPATGARRYRLLETGPEIIPQAFWQSGGDFSYNVDDPLQAAAPPPSRECWLGVTFEADEIIRRWQAPAHVLREGPMTMPAALALFSAPEDHPEWFLAHPDVIVSGLNGAGSVVPIDKRVFEPGSFVIDLANNAVSTSDGRFHWSTVMVELAAETGRRGDRKDMQRETLRLIRELYGGKLPDKWVSVPTIRGRLAVEKKWHVGDDVIRRALGRKK